MLNKVFSTGYTLIAQEYSERQGFYIVLGMRRQEDGSFTYATGCVNNIGLDAEWFWGRYDFTSVIAAGKDMASRV